MKYNNIKEAVFLERPNRFIANVLLDGQEEVCHVKNTGRCRELLTPGASVFLEKSGNPARKTKYDLVGVKKGELMINMDSQVPNKAVEEWLLKKELFKDLTLVRPETKYGSSRFDFYIEAGGRRIFMEVKGVTLEENGVARFPDAPTLRGIKHIHELMEARKEGYEAYIFFVIQMKGVNSFEPNYRTQPEFGEALKQAAEDGVHILAYDCIVERDSIEIDAAVRTRLSCGELLGTECIEKC